MMNLLALVYSDLFISSNAYLENNLVFLLRIGTILYFISLIVLLRKIKDYHFIEINILIMFVVLALVNFIGHASNPFPEDNIYAKEIMITLFIYLIFPVNLKYQVIGGLLFALSNFVSLDSEVQGEKIYHHAIFMLINCNILGFFLSRYFHKTMRKLYLAYNKEQTVETELASKIGELSRIGAAIPICNSCYSVRDDKGYWDNLEHFVTKHSKAHFTHSICPGCSQKMMDELDADEAMNG